MNSGRLQLRPINDSVYSVTYCTSQYKQLNAQSITPFYYAGYKPEDRLVYLSNTATTWAFLLQEIWVTPRLLSGILLSETLLRILLPLFCPAARLWDSWTKLSDCYAVSKPDGVFSEIHCRLFTQRTHAEFDLEGLSFGACLSCCLLRALLGLWLPIGQLCKMWANSSWWYN